MLYDLKYLLTYVPETWTDDLKKCFLHGFSVLVSLLVMMQGKSNDISIISKLVFIKSNLYF